jgi:alpha-mannosidase
MQKHKKITVERLEKFVSKQSWSDVNLRSMIYGERLQLTDVRVFSVPGLERMPLATALRVGKFEPFDRKTRRFGPSWSTHWFQLRGRVPAAWANSEVHLLWDATCESCVYREGSPDQGFLGGQGNDRRAGKPCLALPSPPLRSRSLCKSIP